MDGLICFKNKFTADGSSVKIESKVGLKIAELAGLMLLITSKLFQLDPMPQLSGWRKSRGVGRASIWGSTMSNPAWEFHSI